MSIKDLLRKPAMVAGVLLASGTLVFAAVQSDSSPTEKVNDWSSAAGKVIKVDSGHWLVVKGPFPKPPVNEVLQEASENGYAAGLKMDVLVDGIGHDVSEASGADLDKTLESLHEVVCIAFFWYLDQAVTPEDPADMEMQIGRHLAVVHFPARELPRVRGDLETLYGMARRAKSIDKLAADVMDAVLC